MIKQQYALLDHKASIFLNPISFTNDGDAIRWFTTVVNNAEEKTNINKYPEDFTLYRLADYDDKTGLYMPRPNEPEITAAKPKQLITGVQVQNEAAKTFTIKELITMLKAELNIDNVIELNKVESN